MAETTDKQELAAELARARGKMTGYATAIRRDMDVGARLKTSVLRSPSAWYAGAAVIGLLLSKIPPMRRKVVVEPHVSFPGQPKTGKLAMVFGLLKFAADFAKPALLFWSKRRSGSEKPKATRDERSG
jgi:hypothetical protein